jgi:hypothetical protein
VDPMRFRIGLSTLSILNFPGRYYSLDLCMTGLTGPRTSV